MPGVGILAPESVSGYRMDYSDLHGIYTYRFLENGSFRAEIKYSNGNAEAPRNGKWIWERTDYNKAALTLDGSETLNLTFTTDDHANGTFAGDKRLYAFEFTEL